MRTFPAALAGQPLNLRAVETTADLAKFEEWVSRHAHTIIGLDTETMGLNHFAADFRVRTIQFGSDTDGWVLPVEKSAEIAGVARKVLADPALKFVAHNAPFDQLALSATGHADLDDLSSRMFDTYILAHLLDPRAAGEDGAPGLSLKALAALYIDPKADDGQKALMEVFRKMGRTKATGWSHPDLIDSEVYLHYAALDPILAVRLLSILGSTVRAAGMSDMAHREHRVQNLTTKMEARGLLIDVDYTTRLVQTLHDEEEQALKEAARFGVTNVNSVKQVREALIATGAELTERTASGQLSVGKDVLLPLAGLTPYWSPIPGVTPHPLASAIVRAKRASKWRTSYAESFLTLRDANNRVHPSIKSLAARTARMSISNPPLQQLPSGDWSIRRCVIADPGHVMASTDFEQVELRVVAANAGVANMIDAIETGVDLHNRTADLIWGAGNWTDKQRKIAKGCAFAVVYGGGASAVAKTAGIPQGEAARVMAAFGKAYPEIDRFQNRLRREAMQSNWAITTSFGRRLPLSRARSYAAINYSTQSAARDLFADALLRVDDAGLSDSVLLPVHDELLTQFPVDEAHDRAADIARLMASTYNGVPIAADSEVMWGGSWGSGYGIPADRDAIPAQHANRKN